MKGQTDFFHQDTVEVARQLLGKTLIRRKFGKVYSGRIVETEAYLGFEDPSCHSFHRKLTRRTEAFYRPGGTIYVYLIYGIHYCLNFITGDESRPEAVLIRALEPQFGIQDMKNHRGTESLLSLCNGPGKLCQAFEINLFDNLKSLGDEFDLLQNETPVEDNDIVEASRIGLKRDCDSSLWPLRFYLKNNPFISTRP